LFKIKTIAVIGQSVIMDARAGMEALAWKYISHNFLHFSSLSDQLRPKAKSSLPPETTGKIDS